MKYIIGLGIIISILAMIGYLKSDNDHAAISQATVLVLWILAARYEYEKRNL